MKKIIGIFSIVLVLCLMAVPAMAESMNGGVDFTYADNGNGTYDVKLVVTADSANVAYAMGTVSFDPTVWSATNFVGVAVDNTQLSSGNIALNETSGTDKAYAKDAVVFGFTATCLDEAKMSTSPITIKGDVTICDSTTNNVLYFGNSADWALTIEKAAQDTPATVSAPNMAWAEYTVGNTLYKGIWTGAYTVTAGTKKVDDITVAVNGAAAESLDVEAEAGATVDFKIAVIGKPALDATGIVVTAVEAQ